jgi:hypothetical protein
MLNLNPLFERIREIERQGPQLLRLGANIVKQDIIERTMSGEDVEGNEFIEYTPRYQKKKQLSGLYSGHVDHHWSGALFNSIEYYDGADNSVEVFFSEEYVPIAQGLQIRWGRHWWGVNQITADKMKIEIRDAMRKVLKGEIVSSQ